MDSTRRLMMARQQYESLLIQAGDIISSNNGGSEMASSLLSTSSSAAAAASPVPHSDHPPTSATKRPLLHSAAPSRASNDDNFNIADRVGFASANNGNLSRSQLDGISSSNNNSILTSSSNGPHPNYSRSPELKHSNHMRQSNISSSNSSNSSNRYKMQSDIWQHNSISSNTDINNNDNYDSYNGSDNLSEKNGTALFRMKHDADDSRTVILALQVENERLKEKMNIYSRQAQETISKLQADHDHLENIFSQREKSLLRKIEQQNQVNEILRADFNKMRSELATEREHMLKALRHIDRLKGKSRSSGGIITNLKFNDSKLDESFHHKSDKIIGNNSNIHNSFQYHHK